MKNIRKALRGLIFVAVVLSAASSPAMAETYRSLEGVKGLDVVYDFRLTEPKVAALFLQLIHETYLDNDVRGMSRSPRFVVVVNAGAVKLVARNQPGYSPEDQTYIDEIADRIVQMAEDGIKFEGCLKAAEIFGVDHNLFINEVNKVNNAWISIAGYQAQSFAALPIN